jgi:hypothetical protein
MLQVIQREADPCEMAERKHEFLGVSRGSSSLQGQSKWGGAGEVLSMPCAPSQAFAHILGQAVPGQKKKASIGACV